MNKRHFEAVAQAIRVNMSNTGKDAPLWAVVDDLCTEFKRFNRAFDEARFRAACAKPIKETQK